MKNLIFELIIVLVTILLYFFMKKQNHKNVLKKLLVLFIGVLLFEIMSEPMWNNYFLNNWAFLYNDVSWIITLGWMNIFMISILVVDHFYKKYSEKTKFWLYLLFVTIITLPIEIILLKVGIRDYSVVLTNTLSGINIPFTLAPIEILIVIPMIAALVIPFYKIICSFFKVKQ